MNLGPNVFKFIFIIICLLLISSLFMMYGLSMSQSPNAQQLQLRLYETCETTWKMGFGAIISLLSVWYRKKV